MKTENQVLAELKNTFAKINNKGQRSKYLFITLWLIIVMTGIILACYYSH